MRTGIVNMPLHYGRAPRWLFDRMKSISREITILIVEEYGPEEVVKRFSNPFWFQAFGSLLGFDWHSSGLTTTVCGAFKEGIKGLEKDLSLFAAGGKGKTSRKTPSEIESVGSLISIDPVRLQYASRMAAKVDNSALQDTYQLYHHMFIFTGKGEWAVVQQGMNEHTRYARRYHWLSDGLESFVCEPHKAVCCDSKGTALNLVAKESLEAQSVITLLSCEHPDKKVKELKKLKEIDLPPRHNVSINDIHPERLYKIFISTYERHPEDFKTLLGLKGVGAKTLRALSLIAELLYGVKASWEDPVRYSFAHGGKDGHPYPVNRKVYDESIEFLRSAVKKAGIGNLEKVKALKRLDSKYPAIS